MQLGQAIRYYLEPQMVETGYNLIDARHQKDKKHGVKITLIISRQDGQGITHDDCAAVTQIAKTQFEELLEDYILEVSSQGIKLPKKEHQNLAGKT